MLLWAVTDGAAGTHAVTAPEDAADARRVRAHYAGAFWCATEAGGCGRRLQLVAPDEERPRFHHVEEVACRFAGAGPAAGPAYEHLRYQRALTRWLAGQGHQALVGKARGADGRTDLSVVVPELGCAVQVQLTPLPDTAWRERDDRLRARFRHVTWLHGPDASAAAAAEVSVHGFALTLRRHNRDLALGVRDADEQTRWVRLAACRLTADGVAVPGLDEARALHARRRRERQEAARRAARIATGRARSGSRGAPSWPPSPAQLPFPA
ncbi:hypothetical protein [Geodermatophilus sp. SYSU D00815]